ncbi:MAG: hypothetical protein AB7V46_19550, partial [Thermomicrobiales bacterium]
MERSGTPGFGRFTWDGQNMHQYLDSGNNLIDYFAYEPRQYGNLVASGSPQRFYHQDDIGSTLLLTTSVGVVRPDRFATCER